MDPVVLDTDVLSFLAKADTRALLLSHNTKDYADIPGLKPVSQGG